MTTSIDIFLYMDISHMVIKLYIRTYLNVTFLKVCKIFTIFCDILSYQTVIA